MSDPSLCERCGRCCYAKLILDGEVVYTPFPCPHFDEDTRLCTVYDERHTVNPHCLTAEMGIQLGVFPADCPYVRGLPDYVPPRMSLTPFELEACSEQILDAQDAVRGLDPRDSDPIAADGDSDAATDGPESGTDSVNCRAADGAESAAGSANGPAAAGAESAAGSADCPAAAGAESTTGSADCPAAAGAESTTGSANGPAAAGADPPLDQSRRDDRV